MATNTQEEKQLCDLISSTFNLPVLFINPEGKVVYECLKDKVLNPLYVNQKQNFFNPLNFSSSDFYHFPIVRKTVLSEKYILISTFHHETFKGTVIIGPSVSFPLSEDTIRGIVNDSKAFFYRGEVEKYYHSLPVINSEKLLNIAVFAYYIFNKELISLQTVKDKNQELKVPKENNAEIELVISKNLQINTFHDRVFEKKMLQVIIEGRVDEIKNLPNLKEEEVASVLSKSSYIRSIKNHVITLITLASRASIEGGLHDEIAFSLHDRFIQQIEDANRIDKVREVAKEVLYTFAGKVHQVKNERYSKTITSCKEYIYKHLYDNISHDEIAKEIELSPKYLSVLFKKEVGISVSEYIQQTKIEEAKKLLAYSKTPISEIYSLLNFNDQSYFTKVFKKVVGATPKQYREKHHLLEKTNS